MDLMKTSTASIGRLALAAVFNGSPLARVAPRSTDGVSSAEQVPGKVLKSRWSLLEVVLNALVAVTWLSERKTLRSHPLARDAKAAVTFKDALVTGAVVTGVATVIGEEALKHAYPDGVRVTAKGELSPDTPAGVEAYRRYFKVMGWFNRAFVAGAIAATPLINFALFNEYKPHPIRSFFTL